MRSTSTHILKRVSIRHHTRDSPSTKTEITSENTMGWEQDNYNHGSWAEEVCFRWIMVGSNSEYRKKCGDGPDSEEDEEGCPHG